MMDAQQLELLAYLLEEEGIASPEMQTISPRESSENLPLSFAQQRLWFLNQLEPDSPFYNISAALRLNGVLNVAALEQSFNEIIQRHEVLRTTFNVVDGEPIQVINPQQKLTIKLINLTALPAQKRETEAQQLVNKEAGQPFDLATGPLVRSTLLCLDEAEHILLFTMHHIISDGWSTDILVREVANLYECYCNGKPSLLPELPIQYADYAVWQRQWLQGEVLTTHLDYWKQQLGDSLPVLELPTDRPRPHVQSYQGAVQSFQLPKDVKVALKTLSQQEGCTLFMTLLAAFKVLLYRYTSTEDIVVGSPIANRDRSEIEGLIGFFVNTLVLRTNLSDNPTFRELLGRVREVTLGAYDHQDLPFDLLVEELKPQRDLSHTPLFQVMFVLQNAPMSAVELSGLTLQALQSESSTAKFDLTLLMEETESGIRGGLEYNTDLFDAATIARMAEHLQTILASIVANPEQQIAQLPLLTTNQQHQLLTWNYTHAEYPLNKCIHELFEEQVEKTPDAVAVVFEDQQLTYQELNTKANQLAHYLQKLGVAPDVLVGICIERSLEMVVGLLGIIKAGGAYVPLDPAYPSERLAFMLSDAGVSVLLAQKYLQDVISQTSAQIVYLDQDWDTVAQHSNDTPNSTVQPENLAYVIYTSGSTGQPKGVMIPHRALCNHTLWMQTEFPLTATDRVLQKTPFSFDASVWEFYAPLLAGGKLILAEPGGHKDNAYLLDLIVQQQVSIVQFVPSQLRSLLAEQKIYNCQSLRRVFCGGEVLTIDLQERFFTVLPNVELCNLYGPTEATIDTTYWRCRPEGEQRSVPIGKAIANAQIYLLDSHLQLVPVGVPGEIYIGGDGLARGYLNQPELTAQKFIVNPFTGDTQLYKTGDLGRYCSDGTLEFLGRIDNQVKLRGFRIELAEIEAQLSQHPGVRQNVVVVREDFPGQQHLVAYIVSHRQHFPTVTELRSFLKQTLPDYMVPSVFIPLDALPVLPNGKVDHKSLPIPDTNRPELAGDFVAPRNFIEEKLVQIWGEVIRVENIGIYDNFFELGGDSILSLQVIAKANQAGLQLTPKQLFEYQTIAELAGVANTTTVLQAEQGIVTGSLPLTPIQHWFFEQALPEPHHWNQAVILEVPANSDPSLWEQVVQKLLVHHDALRSCFTHLPNSWKRYAKGESQFVQTAFGWDASHVAPEQTTPFSVVDLSELPNNQQTEAIEATAASLQSSLNLCTGPLLRVVLFQLGRQQPSRLLTIIHHLVVDGVSWRILLEDLQTAYLQLSQGQKIQLPAKTTSFKQWAESLREYAQSPLVKSELDYWLSKPYKQISPLPVDLNGENTVASAASVSVALTPQETQALLQEVPSAYQTQINDVLLTALVQAFYQWTGKNSLLVDLEGHGREDIIPHVDLSRTVGWFTTIFPAFLDLEQAVDPGEALKTIKEQLRSIPNRGINYAILRYLSNDEQLQSLPQAEVIFNYLGQFDQVLSESSIFRPAQESTGPMQSQKGNRNCLLEVNGLIVGGQLQLDWTYSTALHQQATVEKLAQGFIEALRSLIVHCQSPNAGGFTPSDFSQMQFSQQELDQLMAELG
ncbi:amino acid adenylation domain-containing protein [Nostoc sp. UCD121]|uniref:non-ribosomal peptide synthetase n=1 Tax=unclassified Nostoc TaxID=2593658 RepID=UPI0016250AA3|nr:MULTISPECIES: non-ribosomal peptide synthetase [unclassified Nostoc]MBC1218683.1 amino acid adenylation domain-containing protein [Nostoc sp. UCD120]MBC1274870.1 amino acid adenylation domain-containing protein [Nostoc sp. UCD121]MBC1293580.1 amino acid adenylation domain-containing protein [Nostoc sp. UCD122]